CIISGFPTNTAISPSFSPIAITGQSSYPLNSENASPFGTCTVYLSCAEIALPPKTASTTATITITENGILVIAHSCACDCKSNFNRVRSNGDGAMRGKYNLLSKVAPVKARYRNHPLSRPTLSQYLTPHCHNHVAVG